MCVGLIDIYKPFAIFFWDMDKRKKEKCERSQLRSMDWCGERPFGQSCTPFTCN